MSQVPALSLHGTAGSWSQENFACLGATWPCERVRVRILSADSPAPPSQALNHHSVAVCLIKSMAEAVLEHTFSHLTNYFLWMNFLEVSPLRQRLSMSTRLCSWNTARVHVVSSHTCADPISTRSATLMPLSWHAFSRTVTQKIAF